MPPAIRHRSDPRVDPRYLPTFLAVCEAGSVRAAAAALYKTQPAVSYQLQQLERQLGTPLFERVGRRLVLTPTGEQVRDFARRALDEFAGLVDRVARREAERAAPIRLASVSGYGRYVLFPRLLALLGRPPFAELRLQLALPTAEEVYARVERGECDAGAVYVPRISSRLVLRRLPPYEYVAVVPARRPDWLPPPAALREVAAWGTLPFVTYDECDYVFGRWFQALFGRPPRQILGGHHVEDLEEAVGLVAAGFGVTVVPSYVPERRPAGLRVLRPRRGRAENHPYLVTRPSAVRPEVTALLDALAEP
ncbi:MAG TPA: LysR family transcriptional regulator [Gemmatimonadales bacterium]|nr:LysR family transcriptional regulator [Gemmatimonadales bacterium]